jgi:hypothetical protein
MKFAMSIIHNLGVHALEIVEEIAEEIIEDLEQLAVNEAVKQVKKIKLNNSPTSSITSSLNSEDLDITKIYDEFDDNNLDEIPDEVKPSRKIRIKK